jgi:hypothetical protein
MSTMTLPSTKDAKRADDTAAKAITSRKKSRGTEILSGFISAPTELRDRYASAIKRLETSSSNASQYNDLCAGTKSHSQPPIVTKTSHATKTSSSFRNRIWHDDSKQEKRKSSMWRR